MEQFAEISDLEKRWRILDDIERNRAETKLIDASAILSSMCKDADIAIDESDELQAHLLNVTVCEMVKRAMMAPVDQAPMSTFSQSAGGYTESGTFVNPTGDLYVTSSEQKRLGIKRQRMKSISALGGDI